MRLLRGETSHASAEHGCSDCRRGSGRVLRSSRIATSRHHTFDHLQRSRWQSGASLFAGNLVISRGLGNTEEQARNTAEFLIKYRNQFLIDQRWGRRCGKWIENVYYPELEQAGLYFRRDDAGQM